MDKKQLTGLLMISGLMVAYFLIFNNPKTGAATANADSVKTAVDTLADVQATVIADSAPAKTVQTAGNTGAFTTSSDSVEGLNSILEKRFGVFSNAGRGTESQASLKNEKLALTFQTRGGTLVSAKILGEQTYHNRFLEDSSKKADLDLVYSDSASMNLEFYHNNQRIESKDLYFSVVKATERNLNLRAYTNDSTGYIQWSYVLDSKGYVLKVDLSFVGLESVIDRGQSDLPLKWAQIAPRQELNLTNERATSTVYYKTESGSVSRILDTEPLSVL